MLINIDKLTMAGSSFGVAEDFASISGTSEFPLLLLKNPSGSGRSLLLTHFNFAVDSSVTRSCFRVYGAPTITSDGTSVTIRSNLIGGSGSVAQAYKNPTISANGGLLSTILLPTNHLSNGQNRIISVPAGQNFLITVKNDITNVSVFSHLYWVEL